MKKLFFISILGFIAYYVYQSEFGDYNPVQIHTNNSQAKGDLKRAYFSQKICCGTLFDFTKDISVLFLHGWGPGATWEAYPGVVLTVVDAYNRYTSNPDYFFILESYHEKGNELYRLVYYRNENVKITEQKIQLTDDEIPMKIGEIQTIFNGRLMNGGQYFQSLKPKG